jgi:uncharacterized membrane protein
MWRRILYSFAGACWLPVVWIQIKMCDTPKHAMETGDSLPERYWKMDRWSITLGSLAHGMIPSLIA